MMVESRLQGSIDQIDKLIQFETGMALSSSLLTLFAYSSL